MRAKTRTRMRKRVTGNNNTFRLVCTCDLFRIYLMRHDAVVTFDAFGLISCSVTKHQTADIHTVSTKSEEKSFRFFFPMRRVLTSMRSSITEGPRPELGAVSFCLRGSNAYWPVQPIIVADSSGIWTKSAIRSALTPFVRTSRDGRGP